MQLLEQPRSFTKTYGDRGEFSVYARKLWNSLLLDLRKSPSTRFKKGLKTYLFRQVLESGVLCF